MGAKGEVGKRVGESIDWFPKVLPKGEVSESVGEKKTIIIPTELTPQDEVGEGTRETIHFVVVIENGKIS
jgi:hypothetical protein